MTTIDWGMGQGSFLRAGRRARRKVNRMSPEWTSRALNKQDGTHHQQFGIGPDLPVPASGAPRVGSGAFGAGELGVAKGERR